MIRSIFALSLLIAGACWFGPYAQAFDFSGAISAQYNTAIDGGDPNQAELLARVRARQSGSSWLAWTELEACWREETSDVRFEVREAALRTRLGTTELTMGQQIVIWGKADEFNPTDFLNPENLQEFLVLPKADRKLGAPLVKASAMVNRFEIELVMAAMVRGHRLPTHDSPWEPELLWTLRDYAARSDAISLTDDAVPPLTFEHLEKALRVQWSVAGSEVGAVLYQGHDHYPHIRFRSIPRDSGYELKLTPTYASMNGYGLDLFIPLAEWGLRGEIALRDDRTFNLVEMPQELTTSSQLQAVLGLDRTLGDDLYLNCQYVYWDYLRDIDKILEPERLSVVTVTAKYTMWDGDLRIDLDVLAEPENSGFYLLMPSAFYRLSSNLALEAGLLLLDGEPDSYVGDYLSNDFGYLTLKVSW